MIIIVKFIKHKRGNIIINFMLVTIISAVTIFMLFVKDNSTVVVDGKQIEPVTYQKTLSGPEINVDGQEDIINRSLKAKLAKNYRNYIIINLKVFVDNKELNIKSTEKNIASMLKSEQIILSDTDRISPPIQTTLTNAMKVTITRVKLVTIKEPQSIKFNTVTQKNSKLLKSQSSVSQKGILGQKSVTYKVTYNNGKEVSRTFIKETVVNVPQDKIIVQGTKSTITPSRGSSSTTYKKTFSVKATAYCPVSGSKNYTATGVKAVRNAGGISTIAVDPRVIPLGTKLYVDGYGYAIAADTGSGVKGNYIDVYFNSRSEAINWGVRYLKVHILN